MTIKAIKNKAIKQVKIDSVLAESKRIATATEKYQKGLLSYNDYILNIKGNIAVIKLVLNPDLD